MYWYLRKDTELAGDENPSNNDINSRIKLVGANSYCTWGGEYLICVKNELGHENPNKIDLKRQYWKPIFMILLRINIFPTYIENMILEEFSWKILLYF